MNRIEARFGEFRERGESCLIPFITAGHPDLEINYELVLEFERAGAGIVELGVPFSDPIADGVVIQRSSEKSLKRGTSLEDILGLVRRLRSKTSIPLVLLTYYNPVYKRGVGRFVEDVTAAGVDGVIIPDLPPEEAVDLKREAQGKLATIFLLAPTSTTDRIELISQSCAGFIYYVSLTGITGMRDKFAPDVISQIEAIRKFSDLPVGVGFGISTPDQAKEVASFADGVIVGSAIVDLISKNEGNPDLVRQVSGFVSSLIDEIREGGRRKKIKKGG